MKYLLIVLVRIIQTTKFTKKEYAPMNFDNYN